MLKLANIVFKTREQLFYALSHAWNEIPNDTINRYYSSFLARYKVCSSINGESLNSHWKKVNKIHDTYRTQMVVEKNPITGLLQQIETKINQLFQRKGQINDRIF